MKINSLTDVPAIAAYLTRVGAEPRNFRTAVVGEDHGKYRKDIAVIKVKADGTIDAPPDYAPSDAEVIAIKEACKKVEWPTIHYLYRPVSVPSEVSETDPANVFEFRDEGGRLIMIQVRRDKKNEAGKDYFPWTYWSDGQWRKMEPEGLLPLWGIDQLKANTTVFIHEGAKAARAMREMVEAKTQDAKNRLKDHPWGEELSVAAHVGWIGGAPSPERTDWSVLKRAGITRAYIVSDNDAVGIAAVSKISKQLRCPTFHIQFTSEWPVCFDLADDFPKEMFKEMHGQTYYTGPAFRSCVHPATWATDLVTNPRGKPTPMLRDHFKDMWAYVEEADVFVCIEMPDIMRNETITNKMLSGFSDTQRTADLIHKNYHGRTIKLCYQPDNPGRIVTNKSTASINLHIGTDIKATAGDPQPFLDFMAYMFPNKMERHEMLRWVATLIARPDLRMEYGILLISETQGIGKTTLASSILGPLVGHNNVSYPNEAAIVDSEFNDWLGNKRLVIVNEIYSGHSRKAYNKLKSFITDKEVTVNQKYLRPYTTENWCHFLACSNSREALKIEDEDRRWFYPEVTEKPWPIEKFGKLRNWLDGGGLQVIRHWAIEFDDWVQPGQRAPMTARKQELIETSRSDGEKAAADLARALAELVSPAAIVLGEIMLWIKAELQGQKVFLSENQIGKAMKAAGAIPMKQIRINGRLQRVFVNRALLTIMCESEDVRYYNDAVRKHIKQPSWVLLNTL
jgi:hypothetical protein